MGARGPVPKRVDERHGHISTDDREAVSRVRKTGAVRVPPADRSWHRFARDWYRSLAESAQSRFYEPSDWQAARMVATEMTRMLQADFPSPTLFKAIWSAMDGLLTTEGARRRVKVEVERAAADLPDGVADLDEFRGRLSG